MVKVRFYSLGKDFQVLETKNYESKSAAIMAATKHGIDGGYSNVRLVSDEDDYEVRVQRAGQYPHRDAERHLSDSWTTGSR